MRACCDIQAIIFVQKKGKPDFFVIDNPAVIMYNKIRGFCH